LERMVLGDDVAMRNETQLWKSLQRRLPYDKATDIKLTEPMRYKLREREKKGRSKGKTIKKCSHAFHWCKRSMEVLDVV
jgi:hypothetical protein